MAAGADTVHLIAPTHKGKGIAARATAHIKNRLHAGRKYAHHLIEVVLLCQPHARQGEFALMARLP
ncbi:MAG: hypothetical protein ACK55I_08040, partial [bacterium]